MVLLENRNQSIDCVKIVAMFGVMALHTCLSRTNELPGFVLSRMFGLSIPLFFMVSGYLMHGRVIDYKYVFQKIFMILRFTFLVCLIIWFLEILRHDFSWISFPKIWIGSFLQRGPMSVFWYFGAMIMIYAVLPLYNYLEQNNHNFLMHFTIILTCISFIAFIADYSCSFESNYIPQPFRLWYWLLYFSIGQLIKKTVLVGGGKDSTSPYSYLLCFIINVCIFNKNIH